MAVGGSECEQEAEWVCPVCRLVCEWGTGRGGADGDGGWKATGRRHPEARGLKGRRDL